MNDSKLLAKGTPATMFQPQLGHDSRQSLHDYISTYDAEPAFIGMQDNTGVYDWGLGGMLAMNDESSGWKKNTLSWSGKPNLLLVLSVLLSFPWSAPPRPSKTALFPTKNSFLFFSPGSSHLLSAIISYFIVSYC